MYNPNTAPMWFDFVANGHTYRTNPTASYVQYQMPHSTAWVRTRSATVQVHALNHLRSLRVL